MADSSATKANNDELWERLEATIDKRRIAEYIRDKRGGEIIQLIVSHAKVGLGPNDTPFPAYSPRYAKRITKAGGTKFPLRGIGRAGNAGGMLDPANFSFEIDADNVLWLVWTASDDRMAIYGEVHQEGLPLGRNGPRKQRKWMHLEWQGGRDAVEKLVAGVVDVMVEEFNRGS